MMTMKKFLAAFALMIGAVFFCLQHTAMASDLPLSKEANGLPLSNRIVSITSQGHTATFQLYDTVAAMEFYAQLPLNLLLSNFRDAQWMFYPPQRLSVTTREAYHDGVKGELSYYAPWGDAFMLYRDFHARDEMHRLGIALSGADEIQPMAGNAVIQQVEPKVFKGETAMHITVTSKGNAVVYVLNDSGASKSLYTQLPMTVDVENYGGIEKIFYPPKKLNTTDTPLVKGANAGTLAYYAPWGDVVMFYARFGSAAGLYELGHVVSGREHIQDLSGTIRIEKDDK